METLYALLTLCALLDDPEAPLEQGEMQHLLEWAVRWELADRDDVDHYLRLYQRYGFPPSTVAKNLMSTIRDCKGWPYVGDDLPHPAPWLLNKNIDLLKTRIAYLNGQCSLGGFVGLEAELLLRRANETLALYEFAEKFMNPRYCIWVRRQALHKFRNRVGTSYRNGVMPPPG